MLTRIRSKFFRKPEHIDDWSALRNAGYRDVPRHYNHSYASDHADRERLSLLTMGHLR